jgi:RNA polymerase sigma factor (sigma-70 family)
MRTVQDMIGTTEITDDIVIEEILLGNKERYGLLMKRHNQRLYRLAKGYLHDEAEIEDCMQEAYVKAFLNLPNFGQRSSFPTWISRILINECLQLQRRRQKHALVSYNEIRIHMNQADPHTPESSSMRKELRAHLEANITALPEKYRVVFILREVERLNVEETARVLSISEGNVKARLSRAKEMLRESLLETYPVGEVFEFHAVRCERVAQRVMERV